MSADIAVLVPMALHNLLGELIDRPAPTGSWVIDHDEPGLIGYLKGLEFETATQPPSPQRKSVAAHARHLQFALSLLNRVIAGDETAFAGADWAGSWHVQIDSPEQWHGLLDALEHEARCWLQSSADVREWNETMLTGAFGSAAHLAYHLGAIRQIARDVQEKLVRGMSAQEGRP